MSESGLLKATQRRHIAAVSFGMVLLAVAAALLVLAFHYPFVSSDFRMVLPDWIPQWGGIRKQVENWILETGQIVVGPQYLGRMIRTLFDRGQAGIGVMVVGFSILFPALKIIATAMLLLGYRRFQRTTVLRLADLLGFLAKWSMGDIFIVAFVIVLVRAEGFHYQFSAEPGVYCYAASAILASFATAMIRIAVRKPLA